MFLVHFDVCIFFLFLRITWSCPMILTMLLRFLITVCFSTQRLLLLCYLYHYSSLHLRILKATCSVTVNTYGSDSQGCGQDKTGVKINQKAPEMIYRVGMQKNIYFAHTNQHISFFILCFNLCFFFLINKWLILPLQAFELFKYIREKPSVSRQWAIASSFEGS